MVCLFHSASFLGVVLQVVHKSIIRKKVLRDTEVVKTGISPPPLTWSVPPPPPSPLTTKIDAILTENQKN